MGSQGPFSGSAARFPPARTYIHTCNMCVPTPVLLHRCLPRVGVSIRPCPGRVVRGTSQIGPGCAEDGGGNLESSGRVGDVPVSRRHTARVQPPDSSDDVRRGRGARSPITLATRDLRGLPQGGQGSSIWQRPGGSSPLMDSATLLHEIPQQVCLPDRGAAQTLLPESAGPKGEGKRTEREGGPLPTSPPASHDVGCVGPRPSPGQGPLFERPIRRASQEPRTRTSTSRESLQREKARDPPIGREELR